MKDPNMGADAEPLLTQTKRIPTKISACYDAAQRRADAQALHAVTTMLLAEAIEKGFAYYALHLRVALLELEEQIGKRAGDAVLPSDLPKGARRVPKVSAGMKRIIESS